MDPKAYDVNVTDNQWCPGCGNFSILKIVKQALGELDIQPEKLAFVSGMGQAAKFPHYIKCNFFNGLHGRALPGRIREIPLVFEGSVRVPVPFVNRPTETKIIDWEVSGGLRPAIWDMSLYGHSTFSFGIEVGFRSIYLEMIPREAAHPLGGDTDVKLRAHWQGFFTQIGFYF